MTMFFLFYFEILKCFTVLPSPIPGVFTFLVLITCPCRHGFHLCLIIVPDCVCL